MDEAVEDEEAVLEELMPVQHVGEEQNDEMEGDSEQMDAVEEVGEHAEEGPLSSGSSDGFMEVSRLSPPRDPADDELSCANCNNFRDNTLKAFEAAGDMAKLQAEHNDLLSKYDILAKKNAKASMEVEETFKQKRDVEVRLEAVQVDLKMAVDEVHRLQDLNKQYLETAKLADKHRRAADDWREKYVISQTVLVEKVQKYEELEEKYRKAVLLAKEANNGNKEAAKKIEECQKKLAQTVKENKMLKKQCTTTAKFIENLRGHMHLLPQNLHEQLDRLSPNELLELGNINGDPAASDDDDENEILRLMNAGNAVAPALVSPPRQARGAATGRGGRGGRRGRGAHSEVYGGRGGGGKNAEVVDGMHENVLARKLHRNDDEVTPAQPADSAAKSVMGRKTETVREQQERQKAGRKDRIAEMKKDYDAKQSQAKKVADPAAGDAPAPRASAFEKDMLMSDSDSDRESDHGGFDDDGGHEAAIRELEALAAPQASTSYDYDLDMFDFGNDDAEEEGSEREERAEDEGAPEASASKPAMMDSDNEEELGAQLIDSGPNSPAPSPLPSPTVPATLDTVPTEDTVPEKPAPVAPSSTMETEASKMPQEEENEVVPGSCIVEEEERGEEEQDEGAPEASASKPAMMDSDNEEELGALLIDSGPNSPDPSPLPSPTVPATLDTVPMEDTVPVEQRVPPHASSGAAKELQWPVNPPESAAPRVPAQPPKLTPASIAARSPSPAAVAAEAAPAAIGEVAAPATSASAAPVRGGANRGRGRGGIRAPTRGHVPVPGGPLRGSAIFAIHNESRSSASTSDSESQDGPASSISAAAVAAPAAPARRPVATTGGPAPGVPKAAVDADKAGPSAVSLEEKKKLMMANISAASRGGTAARGARGGGRGGGAAGVAGRAGGGGAASASPRVAPSAGGSRTNAMAAQVARMAKNLKGGKTAMSGTVRQRHQPVRPAAAPVDSSSSREVTPPSQHPAAAVAVARRLALEKEKKNSDPLPPKKRKASAMSCRAEAVAIHAPEKAARGPSTSAALPALSAESRLITTVAAVCRGEETVEKAMQELEISTMPMGTIVKCICKALMELPQSNTWHVVWSSMRMKAVEVDGNRVVPKAEKELFKLMQRMRESDQRLDGLFDCFFGEYGRNVLGTMNTSTTTADVARNVRCLFFALVETNKAEDEKVEDAQKFFQQILQKKSSQAVIQSLVFLLCQTNTVELASEILRTELEDDEHRGRLISMHMNNTKDAEVLQWAVNRFAFDSCKTLATAAYKTKATLDMVQGWWASDMEYVEKAREQPGAVSFNARGIIQFDKFNKELIVRTPLLISSQFRIEGLDRVGMLAQLDTPAFEAMDQVFATGADDAVSVFADTSSSGTRKHLDRGEAYVLVIKLHIAMAALTSFYSDRMYGADQREALRLHLALLIEKAHALLESPEVNDFLNSDEDDGSGDEEIGLGLLIAAIRKWREVVQKLTKKDLMTPSQTPVDSSAETSPVKAKRPRFGSVECGSNEHKPVPPAFAR